MRTRLLVVQHEDAAPPAWFGDWLEAAGVELVVVHAHRGDEVPDTLEGYGGLLVLGGAMGAYDDAQHAWLTPTKRLIAQTVREADRAFLGICLGHQLAAVALGGEVITNPRGRTLGLTPVQLTDAGRTDPLLRIAGRSARAVHWNDDIVVTPPTGSRVLARSPDGAAQALQLGPLAWSVQFHPEVSPEVFGSWGASDPPAVAGVAQRVQAAEEELRTTWRPLAERFALMVASHGVRAARRESPDPSIPDWWTG